MTLTSFSAPINRCLVLISKYSMTLTDAHTVNLKMFVLNTVHQGPVVQSIVSLTSSLRGQLVKCFRTL